MLKWLVVAFSICESVWAFLPPVPAMVSELCSGRRPRRGTEVVFRHTLGEVTLEERLVSAGGKVQSVFTQGEGVVVAALEGTNYVVGGERSPAGTRVPIRYLLTASSEDLLNLLIKEGFIDRDQLSMYKPGFDPVGDPSTWDLANNYIRQPGVFMRLLDGTPAVVVSSVEAKAVYFDESFKSLRRLEWKQEEGMVAWNFLESIAYGKEGNFPRTWRLERDGVELVRSELVSIGVATDRAVSDIQSSGGNTRDSDPSGAVVALVRQLLAFR